MAYLQSSTSKDVSVKTKLYDTWRRKRITVSIITVDNGDYSVQTLKVSPYFSPSLNANLIDMQEIDSAFCPSWLNS